MASDNFRESLQPFCIEVEGFPPDTNENQVKQIFQNCLKLEQIAGVQLNQTKWLILFHDKVVTDYYVKQKGICLPNSTLKIGACILCDIPTSWEKVDLKNLAPAVFPGDPAQPNYGPQGAYPGYHGYPPSYQNIQYPNFGQSPGSQGYPMYPGYPQHYGGPQVPTTMGPKPAGSEGTGHIVYPGDSTPPGPPGGQPPQVQGQESKLPGMCGEGEVHEQPLSAAEPGTPQPPKDSDQQKQAQPSDERKSLGNEQGRQEAYPSMPPYPGYQYRGPAPGQEAMYSMPFYPAQYAPRFPGPYPPGLPPPYSPYSGRHPAPNSSPRMNQPHHMPNQPSPAYQAPEAWVEPSETSMNAAETEEEENEEDEEEDEESLGMIKVTGISPQTTEESLTYFFENKRKSGGGDIEVVDFRKESAMAIITFEKPEVVDRVLQKLPLLLDKKQIKVERFVPEKYNSGANVEEETSDKEESKPSCIIEVRGMSEKTSVDTIELYFGNKKAAGKNVEVVNVNDSEFDEGVVYITYETEEVMRAVLDRSHTLDGASLKVTEYIPPPPPKPRLMYDDKVLIKGKNPDTTKDGLENFLEAKTNVTPKHYLPGEEEDTVLVTFEEPPDFEKLEKACMKRALDKHFLKVFRVPVSNCILVKGTAEKTTQSTLEYYFENTRRSGGGDVCEVKVREDGSYLIFFEDHTVIDKVCERSHTVDNQTLDVKLFHELIGDSGEDGPKFKVPDALVITDVDPRKIQFLQHSQTNKDGLEKQLSSQHTTILWPKNIGDSVRLECLLTKEVKDCRTLAKAWKATARSSLDKFLDVLLVFKHTILQEAWSQVMDQLQSMNISHPDGVTVAVEKVSFEIFVMGYKKFATEVSQNVEKIIKGIADELERKKQQIRETSPTLKYHQVMMLTILHYKETTEKKYTGMKVTLDIRAKTVTYEGLFGEVTSAKLEMYEILNNMIPSEVSGFNKGKYSYLQEKAVKQYVAGKMKKEKIMAVWEMNDNRFVVFASTDEGVVRAAHILKGSILETTIDVKKESASLLTSDRWDNEEQNIKAACNVLVYIKVQLDKPCILIYATDTDAEMVRERVANFLTMNTIYDTKLTIGTGMLRYLQSHCLKDIKSIEDQNKTDQVTISVDNLGIKIKGTEVGLSKAKMAVGNVIEKVTKKEHVLQKPGITSLMTSDESKPKVSEVEKAHGVVIVPSDESEDDISGVGPTPTRRDGTQEMARCSQPSYNLMVMMGDMTNLKVDVLVNAANRELLHNGGLAKAIVDKGGKIIQDDCNDYIKQHRQLMEGDVYMGNAGSLRCNYIAHAVGPKWQGGTHREEEHLTEAVIKSLEEANNFQQTSIALPALGAGVFGYPPNKATRTIVEAIDDFYTDNPRNCIRDVYLCDVSQKNVDLFIKALQNKFGPKNVIISDSSGGARDKWSAPKAKPRKGWKKAAPDATPSYDAARIPINISINLVEGQLAQQKVDVIVNTCSKDLKLSNGAVSSSLLAAAGPQIQAECDQNYQGIAFGEIAITAGYNLKCQHVCHGSLPGWDGGATSLSVLQKFMMACLNEASKRGYESVAFPAMGTGNLGYPRDIVAREMYKIVSKYSTQNPTSPVTNVMFVIYDKDAPTIKAFRTVDKSQGMSHGRGGGNRHTRTFGNDKQEGMDHQGAAASQTRDTYREVTVDIENIKLKIYQGDITKAKVDAIVNGTNADFDLTRGIVSNTIRTIGGQGLQRQVKRLEREMKTKGIAVTNHDPGTVMPCEMIIHVDVEERRQSDWKSKFLLAMNKADEAIVSSLAFPAMGTSKAFSTAPEEIATSFVDALVEFINQDPSNVKEIHMVIFDQPLIQKFITAMQTRFQQHKQKKPKSWMPQMLVNLFGGKPSQGQRFQWDPTINVIRQDKFQFPITVYGPDRATISLAIDLLEKLLEKNYRDKVFSEDIVKSFSKKQEKQVYELGAKHSIEVKVDVRLGRIRLTGLLEKITDASDDVNKMIRDCERKKMQKQEAELIGDMVQWHFIDVTSSGEKFEEYPPEINLLLEKGFRDQKDKIEFPDNGGNIYVVDLNALEEFPENDRTDCVKVVRKNKLADATFESPTDWSAMADKDNLSVVPLTTTDPAFTSVQQQFLASVGGARTVIKIERIQNRTLYQQYVAKKKLVDIQNSQNKQNEKKLWHGTATETVASINSHGFNRSYCGKNATAFGDGVYFAVNASYSASTTYSRPDPSGHQRMYLCKVITGEFTQGTRGMRVPPAKGQAHLLYDSVVDTPANPGMYIVFNDTQAYPEYLITFQ